MRKTLRGFVSECKEWKHYSLFVGGGLAIAGVGMLDRNLLSGSLFIGFGLLMMGIRWWDVHNLKG